VKSEPVPTGASGICDSAGSGASRQNLAYAYAVSGKKAEVEKLLAEVLKQKRISETGVAGICANLATKGKAFEWLEKAYGYRTIGLGSTLRTDPTFDPPRPDPRFASLLRRTNLEP